MTARDGRAPRETRHDPVPSSPGGVAASEDSPVHDHPLPKGMRLLLVVYGALLFLLVGALLLNIVRAEAHDREVTRNIIATIDARTAERDREAALVQEQLDVQEAEAERRSKQTRAALCIFIAEDLGPRRPGPNPALTTLAKQFDCPVIPQ